jgi:hypothetical protein
LRLRANGWNDTDVVLCTRLAPDEALLARAGTELASEWVHANCGKSIVDRRLLANLRWNTDVVAGEGLAPHKALSARVGAAWQGRAYRPLLAL